MPALAVATPRLHDVLVRSWEQSDNLARLETRFSTIVSTYRDAREWTKNVQGGFPLEPSTETPRMRLGVFAKAARPRARLGLHRGFIDCLAKRRLLKIRPP
jgi:hypothetical protein